MEMDLIVRNLKRLSLLLIIGICFTKGYSDSYPFCSDGTNIYISVPTLKVYTITTNGSWSIYNNLQNWYVSSMTVLSNKLYAIQDTNSSSGGVGILWNLSNMRRYGFNYLHGKMTAYGRYLYIICNNKLYKFNPVANTSVVVGNGNWSPPVEISTWGTSLYILQNSRLHRVNPDNGTWEVLGNADWAPPYAITAFGFFLYILQNNRLHRVDPNTGQWQVVGTTLWGNDEAGNMQDNNWAITGHKGYLWIVVNRIVYRVNSNTGAIQ